MIHTAEEWTDRKGQHRVTCALCEETWPCFDAPRGRPDGYLIRGRLTAERIVEEVARGFNVAVDDIFGAGRQRHVWMARACAMAVVKQSTSWSYTTVGKYFGRDHQTVFHNIRRVMEDPELSESVRLVVQELSPPPTLFSVEVVADEREAM